MKFWPISLWLLSIWLVNPRQLLSLDGSWHSCDLNLAPLSTKMLQDLPSYTNRVIQRSRRWERNSQTYIVVAGKAQLQPLPINSREYTRVLPESSQQLFFTTLERRYTGEKMIESQNYHWLFLSKTASGWRLVTIFSRLGVGSGEVSSPPIETSNGTIGQAIQLWLRDCRSGKIKP